MEQRAKQPARFSPQERCLHFEMFDESFDIAIRVPENQYSPQECYLQLCSVLLVRFLKMESLELFGECREVSVKVQKP